MNGERQEPGVSDADRIETLKARIAMLERRANSAEEAEVELLETVEAFDRAILNVEERLLKEEECLSELRVAHARLRVEVKRVAEQCELGSPATLHDVAKMLRRRCSAARWTRTTPRRKTDEH